MMCNEIVDVKYVLSSFHVSSLVNGFACVPFRLGPNGFGGSGVSFRVSR